MIELKHVSKTFDAGTAGGVDALKDVSLTIEDGDIYGIIGMSGAGKSTLVRCINLLEKPTYGEIWVEGKLITPPDPYLHWDVIRASHTYAALRAEGMDDESAIMKIKKEDLLKPHEGGTYNRLMKQIVKDHFEDTYSVRRRVGMVSQHFNLFPHMTVLENMIYAPMKVNKVSREEAVEKARALLNDVGMLSKIDAYPGKLSGGQRRRIDIARALLHEPEILILDEPTTGLDPQTRLLLWSVVMQLRAEHGLTVFLTTHYMEEAADADYVVILDSGSIAAEGTPLELKNRFTGDFITLYGVTPEKAAALGEYRVESTRDGIRIAVKNTAEATQLILKHPELFTDYEIKKGGMDDVFLAATGKKLSGGVES